MFFQKLVISENIAQTNLKLLNFQGSVPLGISCLENIVLITLTHDWFSMNIFYAMSIILLTKEHPSYITDLNKFSILTKATEIYLFSYETWKFFFCVHHVWHFNIHILHFVEGY